MTRVLHGTGDDPDVCIQSQACYTIYPAGTFPNFEIHPGQTILVDFQPPRGF